jgi:hypothetical protein
MRILRTPLGGLFLLGLAVVVAVLALGQGGARPAAAQPADPHYKCYDIVGTDPPNTVDLMTHFGVESVAVGQATKLCLPAGKDGQPIPSGWPDLKCYDIEGQDPPNVVTVTTQFGGETGVAVGQASLLCVPAAKTMMPEDPALAPPPPDRHWECFNIAGSDPPNVVTLETRFGVQSVVESGVAVGQATKLCAPALKNGDGDLTVPGLKCYNITGSPPAVAHVNLTTQFGVEPNVTVLAPSLLCVPFAPFPVGGIAELAPLAGASAEEAGASAGGSGWSTGGYAALAAGLAAAVVALSAGAWYARRRWLS